ncbi:unnamed protein product [Calicophoron daubneyi]|uniref:Rho GTPase-activating protein 26 n=1 Tax=Calicophoron daubneyi TaxID=300641 RepID=A0AAV2TCU4_CALDB
MPPLKPLEFRDCVIDGPHFRTALHNHEKDLKASSKRVKEVLVNAERVFKAMEQLQQSISDFATSLMTCGINGDVSSPQANPDGDRSSQETSEVSETDDERVLKTALSEYAKILRTVEEARCIMLVPIKEMMLAEITELRTVWLAGQKTDPKAFLKDTASFCQKLEKYVGTKNKEPTAEMDEQMLQERQKFISRAFEHVTNIHEAEELRKSKFVQTISLFMQMLSNFYHQAYEHFQDSNRQMIAINIAAQRSAENFRQICDETKELKEKLLKMPWEQIQAIESNAFREGYLFVPVKKAVTTLWVKHFCTYNRDLKVLELVPYTQGRVSESSKELVNVKSCVRRPSDSIDRRFCFDIEVDNKSTPMTLQAQSLADLREWLQIMDGTEPVYAERFLTVQDPDKTQLTPQSIEFLCNLMTVIEEQGLMSSGLYRISGVKSKISALVRQALTPPGISKASLMDYDIHLLTGAVKHFVRHLEEPLTTYSLHDDFLAAVKRDPAERVEEVSRLIKQLPEERRKVLGLLITHLAKVAAYSRVNNMTVSNLSIVFAPSLLRSREETVAAIMNTKFASTAIEIMIQNCTTLFNLGSSPPEVAKSGQTSSPPTEPTYNVPNTSPTILDSPNATPPVTTNCASSYPIALLQSSLEFAAAPLGQLKSNSSGPNSILSSPHSGGGGDQRDRGIEPPPRPAAPRLLHSSQSLIGSAFNRNIEPLKRRRAPLHPDEPPRPPASTPQPPKTIQFTPIVPYSVVPVYGAASTVERPVPPPLMSSIINDDAASSPASAVDRTSNVDSSKLNHSPGVTSVQLRPGHAPHPVIPFEKSSP